MYKELVDEWRRSTHIAGPINAKPGRQVSEVQDFAAWLDERAAGEADLVRAVGDWLKWLHLGSEDAHSLADANRLMDEIERAHALITAGEALQLPDVGK